MSWKSFACLAAVAAMSAPALAQPSFSVVDGTLQVVVDATGSVAVEVAISGSDIAPVSTDPADALFDTPNPGDNPFTGTVTNGAVVDGNDIFISYGSAELAPGTYDLWDFMGTGTADVTGLIAQGGVNFEGLTATIDFGGGFDFGDIDMDGDVDIIDFGNFADAFGTVDGDAAYNVLADSEPDADVDIIDFGAFADNFGNGTSVAVPEPSAMLLGLFGIACLGGRRSA